MTIAPPNAGGVFLLVVNNALLSTMHLSAAAMHATRAILLFSRFYRALQRVTAA
jgi:hypothetical protein